MYFLFTMSIASIFLITMHHSLQQIKFCRFCGYLGLPYNKAYMGDSLSYLDGLLLKYNRKLEDMLTRPGILNNQYLKYFKIKILLTQTNGKKNCEDPSSDL